jgi:L-fucose isomerase-like protein
MSRKTRLGYAPLSQAYYSKEWAHKIHTQSLAALRSINAIQLYHPAEMITTEEDARKAAREFKQEDIDVLLMQSINCDLAIPATVLGQECQVPLLVWSTPEPLMHDKPLLANSLCGGMIVTSTLRRLGLRYKHMHGLPDDAEFLRKMVKSIEAAAIVRKLRESRLALIGYQVPGFHHVSFDEMLLRRVFGVQLQHVDISEVYAESKKISNDAVEAEVKAIKNDSRQSPNLKQADFDKTALLSISLRNLSQKYGTQAVAVKCMPELLDEFKIVPCAALGKITDDGIMAACEGDVAGALTMLVEYYLTNVPPFFVDLISVDEKSNTGIGWHCGNGPARIAEDARKLTYGQHSIVSQESPLGLTRDFVCRTGEVTFARISERDTGYMMFAAGGEAIRMDDSPRGTSMKIRFHESVGKINDILFEQGVENHFSIVYGDIREELRDFSKWMNMECVIL